MGDDIQSNVVARGLLEATIRCEGEPFTSQRRPGLMVTHKHGPFR